MTRFFALLGATRMMPTSALADACADRATVVASLESDFSEQLAMGGLQNTEPFETVFEIWASEETGTFTVLLTNPDGTSCIVAAGTEFFSRQIGSAPASSKS